MCSSARDLVPAEIDALDLLTDAHLRGDGRIRASQVEVVDRSRIHGLLQQLMEPGKILDRLQLRQDARWNVSHTLERIKAARAAARGCRGQDPGIGVPRAGSV